MLNFIKASTIKPTMVVRLLAKMERSASSIAFLSACLCSIPFCFSLIHAYTRENGVIHGNCQLQYS